MNEHPWVKNLTVRQRGGWVLFQILSHLALKERPFMFTVTWCLWIRLEANNWTSSNIHWNHQWYWSYYLKAHNTLNGTTHVSIVYLMRACPSWKKPLISFHTVTQPHTRSLAMRTTWMIQIACLAGSTVLTHFTALYIPSICAVQRRQVVCISMVHVHD